LPLSDVPKGTNTYIDANIFLFIAFKEKHFEESKDFLQFLKKNPDKIQELTKCWNALEKILSLNITILDTPKDFRLIMNNCKEYKLMTRDALHVSVMKSNGISHIATGDEDFKGVQGLTVWIPIR